MLQTSVSLCQYNKTLLNGVDRLRRLDDDVLTEIFELLRPSRDMRPLSMTCKWIREACKPILFSRVHISSWDLSSIRRRFLPQDVWPYIRSMRFWSTFEVAPYPPNYFPGDLDDVAEVLGGALRQMVRLRTVSICGTRGDGVPRAILRAIMFAPHLESFELAETLDRRNDLELALGDFRFSIPPLRYFLYLNSKKYRTVPRHSIAEMCLLASVVEQASETLETLIISSEPAPPLATIAHYPWPRLQHLKLQGERTRLLSASSSPMIALLACMPSLRTLVLELATTSSTPEPLWPTDYTGELPWPELRLLSIAYPHPDDRLFDYLPPTLSSLALRCWPRHYIFKSWPTLQSSTHLGWRSPVLSSTQLLGIARRCQSPHIQVLDVEYEQDADDAQLLAFLPSAFPNLTTLTLNWYRMPGADDADVPELAHALVPLVHLRVLRVYLDPVHEPHPALVLTSNDSAHMLRDLVGGFQLHVNTFARTLTHSLKFICFLPRQMAVNEWLTYRVIADANGGRRGQYDPIDAEDEIKLPKYDTNGPLLEDDAYLVHIV